VIELQEGARDFRTWLRLEDGTAILHQPEHLPAAAEPQCCHAE